MKEVHHNQSVLRSKVFKTLTKIGYNTKVRSVFTKCAVHVNVFEPSFLASEVGILGNRRAESNSSFRLTAPKSSPKTRQKLGKKFDKKSKTRVLCFINWSSACPDYVYISQICIFWRFESCLAFYFSVLKILLTSCNVNK
jgi:hypothetical protein